MIVSKSMRLTLLDIYMAVICLFPIATTLFAEGMVNKAMFGIMLALQISQLFMNPMKKGSFVCIFILIANFGLVVAHTQFPLYAVNMLFYYPFFLLYTYFMCDNRKTITGWFRRHEKFVRGVVMVWTVLVLASMFMPSSYHTKEAGNVYFGSYCGSIFRLGQSAMLIQVLALVSQVYFKRRKDMIFQILPVVCAYMGSSRTYLVVCVLIFVVAYYIFCKERRVFWATIIPLGVLIIWLVGKTAIGDKIETTLDEDRYGDFWFRITSARSEIWETIMSDWNTQPIFKKMLGVDLNHSFQVAGLWAHNDFIEILSSFGIIGLIHYLYAVIHLLRTGYGRVRVPFLLSLCVFMVWLFNAFFNMHYVYFCAMMSLPFLVFVLRDYCEETFGVRRRDYLTVQHYQKTEG